VQLTKQAEFSWQRKRIGGRRRTFRTGRRSRGQRTAAPPDPNFLLASAEFGLGEQLYKAGHLTEAIVHFKEAQRLNPKSWNYKRQAYKLSSESDYGTTFMKEVEKAGGSKVYYAPPDLPKAGEAPEKKPGAGSAVGFLFIVLARRGRHCCNVTAGNRT
jgi:hypothetical protein